MNKNFGRWKGAKVTLMKNPYIINTRSLRIKGLALIISLLVLAALMYGCLSEPAPGVSEPDISIEASDVEVSKGTETSSEHDGTESNEDTSADVSSEDQSTEDSRDTNDDVPSGEALEDDYDFWVHFIDVGQADAALVHCDGKYMLIDGGNTADSSLIYSYLKKRDIAHLDYIVCTHAHEDHVGGLSGALNFATVGTAFCPVTSYSTKAFSNFTDQLAKQNKSITLPKLGQTFKLGSAKVTVLGPVKETENTNNTSIVLRIVYGKTSFLFTGDMEREAEQDILESGVNLKSTVLKVGHHGSDTSTTYPFLREVMPEYGVISCEKDNSYGHPHEGVLSKLRDAEVKVFRTDMQGTVICYSDGKSVEFVVEKNKDADTFAELNNPDNHKEMKYILNTSSKKFHLPECSSVKDIKDNNKKEFFGTRLELIELGYSPCGTCKP